MVMATEQHRPCWHYPAWNLLDSNHVATHLEPMHHTNLPSSFNSHVFTANAVSQGISALVPGSPYSRTNQLIGVHGVLQPIPTHINCSSPSTNLYMNESQSALFHGIGRKVVPTSACGKKFLFFDHSGDQTRLFFSPLFPPRNELLSRKTFDFDDNGLGHGKLTALVEHRSPGKLIIQEQLDRSYSNSYGSERPEDTEEINALLYSDDGDVDGEDDEVTSTGHSPFPVQGGCHEHAQFGELTGDIASSDGSSKRQKLHDGGYRKSSLKDTASSVQLRRSHRYDDDDDDDTGSSCVKGTEFKGQEQSPHSHASKKKAKIHEMLKILETIIPGLKSNLKSKDPLSIFDEAIDYLKHLRLKAKELGLEPSPVPPSSPLELSGAVLAEGEGKKWADLDYVFPRNDYF